MDGNNWYNLHDAVEDGAFDHSVKTYELGTDMKPWVLYGWYTPMIWKGIGFRKRRNLSKEENGRKADGDPYLGNFSVHSQAIEDQTKVLVI